MPLLDETGYIPTMKFASGFEIFEYCQLMAERYGFYDHCLFHTDGRPAPSGTRRPSAGRSPPTGATPCGPGS